MFSRLSVFVVALLSLKIESVYSAICYECSNPKDLSTCNFVDSSAFGNLGCLIELEDEDDTGFKINKITRFCPSNFTECSNLAAENNTWLSFVWKMHNTTTSTIRLRKNPVMKMWFECFHDKCNNPEYIESLKSVAVTWKIENELDNVTISNDSLQCYTCQNLSEPFVCTGSRSCSNSCKMQGFRLNTNPVASRLFNLYNVNFWQPQCNNDFILPNLIDYSINGYFVYNLNNKTRNTAVEAYCKSDNCNQLYHISGLMNDVSIKFDNEPWSNQNSATKVFSNCLILTILAVAVSAILF